MFFFIAVDDDHFSVAGDLQSLPGGHSLTGVQVDHLVIPQTFCIEFQIFGGFVVELNALQVGHFGEKGDQLSVAAAQMDHTAVGVDTQQRVVQRHDEFLVQTGREEL